MLEKTVSMKRNYLTKRPTCIAFDDEVLLKLKQLSKVMDLSVNHLVRLSVDALLKDHGF
jgi:hypothetical protein